MKLLRQINNQISLRSRRAESLLEALISVSLIMFMLYPITAVYINSHQWTEDNRNHLLAAPLADEGIELMKNLMATNNLRFEAKPECWNAKPAATRGNCSELKLEQGSYILKFEPTNADFEFKKIDRALDVDLTPDDTLSPAELAKFQSDMLKYRLKLNPTTHFYGHDNGGTDTPYYREIAITCEISDETLNSDANPSVSLIKAVSTVLYRAGKQVGRVRRSASFNAPAAASCD